MRGTLFVLVLILSALVGLWLGIGKSTPGANTSSPSGSRSSESQRANELGPHARTGSVATGAGRSTESAVSPANTPAAGTNRPGTQRSIEFKTRSGDPAAGVVILLSHHLNLNPDGVKTRVDELTTDAHGRIQVASAPAGPLPVRVKSTGWRFINGTQLVDGWYHPGPWPVVLEQTRALTVWVFYADGTPYEGELSVSPEALGSTETFEVARGIAEAVVPDQDSFGIWVSSRRVGFSDAGVRFAARSVAVDRLDLILAAQEATMGVIEVDLSAFARTDNLLVEVIGSPVPYSLDYRARTIGGGVFASPGRRPGGYRVFVREDPTGALLNNKGRTPPATPPNSLRVWQSDVVQVAAGQTVRVVAGAEYASAVRARLVNERGEVLAPGILFVEPDTKLPSDWSSLKGWYNAPKPWSAIHGWPTGLTIEDGYGELPIVDPGKRVIACEAPGYDISFVEVDCKPGRLHDLGTVVLKPARGVIEIEIINWDPKLTYVVELCEWAGRRLREPVVLTGETGPTFRFEGLALRWYTILVDNKEAEVGAWSRNARLSDTKKVARLKFEMHKAPLPEKVIQPDE